MCHKSSRKARGYSFPTTHKLKEIQNEEKTLKKEKKTLSIKCRMTSLESPDRKSGSSRENFLIAAAVGQNKTKPLRQKQNKTVSQKNLARSPTLLLSLTGHISNKTSDGVQFSFQKSCLGLQVHVGNFYLSQTGSL